MTAEVAYFQTGTYGPASDSVLQAVRETMEKEARHGPATPAGRQAHVEREASARRGLARMLNVREEELSIDHQHLAGHATDRGAVSTGSPAMNSS